MKSKRKVLLALTINKQYFIRGVVRYAREHDWYLVTDTMYTGLEGVGSRRSERRLRWQSHPLVPSANLRGNIEYFAHPRLSRLCT